jgi:hypothetical protein
MALDHTIDFPGGSEPPKLPLCPAQFPSQSAPALQCHNHVGSRLGLMLMQHGHEASGQLIEDFHVRRHLAEHLQGFLFDGSQFCGASQQQTDDTFRQQLARWVPKKTERLSKSNWNGSS